MIKAEFKSYGSYTTDSVSQWDLNQKLTISGLNINVAPVLAFSCFGMYESIIVQSKLSNGVIICDVPNAILQFGKNLNVDLCSETGGQYKAFEKMIIPVNRRKKPSDYLFTDNVPLYTAESIKADLQELLNNTPYMTIDKESADLPVHTINDDEIGVASTWSSEKINGKIQEVFQNASNGKSKLATAIGNEATADMTWDQLAGKVLQFDFQSKSSEGTVYFNKAFDNVVVWIVAGANYGIDMTGFVKIKHMDGAVQDEYEMKGGGDNASYGINADGTQVHAKMYPPNDTHTICYYYSYQIGYNN
mgnify:CR=1 FL=1